MKSELFADMGGQNGDGTLESPDLLKTPTSNDKANLMMNEEYQQKLRQSDAITYKSINTLQNFVSAMQSPNNGPTM